ncbi:UNVERIFIED_CONTAM: hypothetical protein HDU68_009756 [Siphonaria sp. JEL0065]|nr:hypothetical protein HDU68_009756 [Siphonaria sp. JEL0065]
MPKTPPLEFLTAEETLEAVTVNDTSDVFIKQTIEIPIEEAATQAEFPDGGGEAWLQTGMVYSFGIYNSYYLQLGIGSAFEVAMIGSVGPAAIDALGILSGYLSERFGFRTMILIGSIILCTGLFLSSFTTSVPLLILTQGLLYGIGASLVYFPAVSLPAQYFEKKRGLATGLAVAGTGCGGLVFSIITEKMITSIGLPWTLRATAIMCFGM